MRGGVQLFVGNLSYQEALRHIDSGLINILFSTSALFTLFLASIFPASSSDRFTLSKLVAVSLRSVNILPSAVVVFCFWQDCGLQEPL